MQARDFFYLSMTLNFLLCAFFDREQQQQVNSFKSTFLGISCLSDRLNQTLYSFARDMNMVLCLQLMAAFLSISGLLQTSQSTFYQKQTLLGIRYANQSIVATIPKMLPSFCANLDLLLHKIVQFWQFNSCFFNLKLNSQPKQPKCCRRPAQYV